MTEKQYEELLIKNPSIIDPEAQLFKKNQLKLSDGSVVDVVFYNPNQDIYYLVELQKNRVDKHHLGKILIYKNIFSKDFNIRKDKIQAVIVADSLVEDYSSFLKEFNIKFKSMNLIQKESQCSLVDEISNNLKNIKKYKIRGSYYILDKDVSKIYQISTRHLNIARSRHMDNLESHSFKITKEEYKEFLKENNMKAKNHRSPVFYSDEGFYKIASCLNSQVASEVFDLMYQTFKNKEKRFQNIQSKDDFVLEIAKLMADNQVNQNKEIMNLLTQTIVNANSLDMKGVLDSLKSILEIGSAVSSLTTSIPDLIRAIEKTFSS